MFGLAYVILPFSDRPPAEAITQSLARFQCSGRGTLPEEWLRFRDETAELRAVYERTYNFRLDRGLRTDGTCNDWYLSARAVIAAMEERGRDTWTVRFAEIEPDFAAFVAQYVSVPCERHPVTGGWGRWLNHLGQWDWWDLGGRFNGVITGNARDAVVSRPAISSGYSRGREAFEKLVDVLADVLGDDQPEEIDVASDDNIELVATLADAAASGLAHAIPGALVLPPGSAEDTERWLDAWPDLFALAGTDRAKSERRRAWNEIVATTYARFRDHWAAAVAYHF